MYTSSFATTFHATNNKLLKNEAIISNQNREIDLLRTQLINSIEKNQEMKMLQRDYINLKDKIKSLEIQKNKMNKEKLDIIKKRDENYSLLNRKINQLENVIELEKLDYEKNTVLYKQKMSVYNHLLMENEVYSEEVEELKKNLNEFENKKKEELQKEKVVHLLKYEKLKKKMLDTIKQSNEEASKLNMEYMDVSNKLSILQNKQLMIQIDYQKEKINDLEKMNKELMNTLYEYEKEIETHQLVEKDLIEKNKANNSINNEENTKHNTFYFKKKRKFFNSLLIQSRI